MTYSWSTDEEHYFGEFETREEAAMEAVMHDGCTPGQTVYVGENMPHSKEDLVRGCIDADQVIERLAEHAYDNVGEHVEDWPDVSKEDCKKLDEALAAAILPFIDEPRFWSIERSKPVRVTNLMFAMACPADTDPHCRHCFEPMGGGAMPDASCEVMTLEVARKLDAEVTRLERAAEQSSDA